MARIIATESNWKHLMYRTTLRNDGRIENGEVGAREFALGLLGPRRPE